MRWFWSEITIRFEEEGAAAEGSGLEMVATLLLAPDKEGIVLTNMGWD